MSREVRHTINIQFNTSVVNKNSLVDKPKKRTALLEAKLKLQERYGRIVPVPHVYAGGVLVSRFFGHYTSAPARIVRRRSTARDGLSGPSLVRLLRSTSLPSASHTPKIENLMRVVSKSFDEGMRAVTFAMWTTIYKMPPLNPSL
ncbi:hypothetical protein TcWFU_008060 [Taenia crassiceps]|uniref:Uncharacterized protein n=1 Tax=Taenia crassiceps TaxID=6207 RepID=A0ABR4QM77_9CEST